MVQPEKRSKITLLIIFVVAFLVITGSYLLFKKPSNKIAPDVAEFFALIDKEGPTSLELLDKAVEEKKIKPDQALLYKLYSIFGDDRLPAEYQSDHITRGGNLVLKEVAERFEKMPKDIKPLVAPFLKRPDDPESYYNISFSDEPAEPEATIFPTAYAERPMTNIYTEFLTSSDGKVKIWYPNRSLTMKNIYYPGMVTVNATDAKKEAEMIKKHLDNDTIIQDFIDFLGKQLIADGTRGGDGKLDIYVAPCGKDLGLTFGEGGITPTSSYVIMSSQIGPNRDVILKTTLAHELFHVFQNVFKYDGKKDNWWSEATAVWSENFEYPADNTEQGWLKVFFHSPLTSAYKETPPDEHHYGAYILAYYMSSNFQDEIIKKSWYSCEQKTCLDGVDELMDGNFKKHWKEFTLWNYNKEPAQIYMDWGPFSTVSTMGSSDSAGEFLTGPGEFPYDVQEVGPLAADYSDVSIDIGDAKDVKKIVFKDLKNFTGKSDRASIKAVIYYKNGKNDIEDWTDKNQRSFCIENADENLDHVVLIFSNSDMKKKIEATKFKAVTKNSCFEINQEDQRTAVIHMSYMNAGTYGSIAINTTTNTRSEGEPTEDSPKEAQFAYQSKWKLWFEFEQIRDAFTFPCGDSTLEYAKGWITRAAGYLEFNLSPDKVGKDGTFPVDLEYGFAHPKGKYEEVPAIQIKCIGVGLGSSKIDVTQFKGTSKGIYTGKITEMTDNGAKIELTNACMYDNCDMQDGSGRFQDISEKIILTIKKGSK